MESYIPVSKKSAYLEKRGVRRQQPGWVDIDAAVQELISSPVPREKIDETVRRWFVRTQAQPAQALVALAECVGEQWTVPVSGVFTLICYLLDHHWRPPAPLEDVKAQHKRAKNYLLL